MTKFIICNRKDVLFFVICFYFFFTINIWTYLVLKKIFPLIDGATALTGQQAGRGRSNTSQWSPSILVKAGRRGVEGVGGAGWGGGEGEGRGRSQGGVGGGSTGVILHSLGVCLAGSAGGRAEDYGITSHVAGHVSPWSTLTLLTASQ